MTGMKSRHEDKSCMYSRERFDSFCDSCQFNWIYKMGKMYFCGTLFLGITQDFIFFLDEMHMMSIHRALIFLIWFWNHYNESNIPFKQCAKLGTFINSRNLNLRFKQFYENDLNYFLELTLFYQTMRDYLVVFIYFTFIDVHTS